MLSWWDKENITLNADITFYASSNRREFSYSVYKDEVIDRCMIPQIEEFKPLYLGADRLYIDFVINLHSNSYDAIKNTNSLQFLNVNGDIFKPTFYTLGVINGAIQTVTLVDGPYPSFDIDYHYNFAERGQYLEFFTGDSEWEPNQTIILNFTFIQQFD